MLSPISPISTHVIAAFLRLSTRINCNLRSSTPISRLPHRCHNEQVRLRLLPDHIVQWTYVRCCPHHLLHTAISHLSLTVRRPVKPTRSLVLSKKVYGLLALISRRCRSLPFPVLYY